MTAGFFAKFYIIAAGASSSTWALIVILVVASAVGLFYYLRIVVAVYSNLPNAARKGTVRIFLSVVAGMLYAGCPGDRANLVRSIPLTTA